VKKREGERRGVRLKKKCRGGGARGRREGGTRQRGRRGTKRRGGGKKEVKPGEGKRADGPTVPGA